MKKTRTYSNFSLEHDQPSLARGDELLKHLLKVLGNLLERPLDRLVLALVESGDELFDRVGGRLELRLSRVEIVALLREVGILSAGMIRKGLEGEPKENALVGLLVDSRESLERLVDLAQLSKELWTMKE